MAGRQWQEPSRSPDLWPPPRASANVSAGRATARALAPSPTDVLITSTDRLTTSGRAPCAGRARSYPTPDQASWHTLRCAGSP